MGRSKKRRNTPPSPVKVSDMTYPYAYGQGDYYAGTAGRNRDLIRTDAGAALAYQLVGTVNRCIEIITNAVNNIPWELVVGEGDNERVIASNADRRPKHAFAAAMRGVYVEQSIPLRKLMSYSELIYGETYIEKCPVMVLQPRTIKWLNPLWTEPQIAGGWIQFFRYTNPWGEFAIIPPEAMAYEHTFNPQNDLRGYSVVNAVLDEINIDRDLKRFLKAFFRNNARPGMVISPKGDQRYNQNDIATIKEQIQNYHKGVDNGNSTLVSPISAEYEAFDAPDVDKQYTISTEIRTEIYMGFGVPPSLAGDSGGATYKDGEEVLEAFYFNTINPMAERQAAFINTFLMPFFDPSGQTTFRVIVPEPRAVIANRTAQATLINLQLSSTLLSYADAARAQKLTPDPRLEELYNVQGVPVPIDQLSTYWERLHPAPALLPDYTVSTPAPMISAPETPQLASGLEPVKGAASLCVMLSLANNPDLIDLQKRLKAMYPDPSIKWSDPSDFHVTLLYVPAIEEERISELVDILPDTDLDGLSLKIGSLACFDNVGEHALHFRIARNSGLLDRQAALFDTCEALELQASSYSNPAQYTPHITMGYLPERIGRIVFHGKVSVAPTGVICSVERGGEDEIVYPMDDTPLNAPIRTHERSHIHELSVMESSINPLEHREKALNELKAWQRFAKAGTSKRAFVFEALKGDPVDFINARLAESDTPSVIVDVLMPRFNGSRLKRLEKAFNEALAALLADDEASFLKSIDEVRSEFEDRLNPVIDSLRDGSLDNRRRAGNIIRQLIRQFGSRAYRQGLADSGVDDVPDEEEQAEIDRLLAESSTYVSNFTNEMINGAGITADQARDRAGIWFNGSISPLYNAGLLAGNKNQMMEFELGSAEEHCVDCPRLNKQRHRFKDIVKRNLDVPKVGQATECEGWNCKCKWVPVTGKARGSW